MAFVQQLDEITANIPTPPGYGRTLVKVCYTGDEISLNVSWKKTREQPVKKSREQSVPKPDVKQSVKSDISQGKSDSSTCTKADKDIGHHAPVKKHKSPSRYRRDQLKWHKRKKQRLEAKKSTPSPVPREHSPAQRDAPAVDADVISSGLKTPEQTYKESSGQTGDSAAPSIASSAKKPPPSQHGGIPVESAESRTTRKSKRIEEKSSCEQLRHSDTDDPPTSILSPVSVVESLPKSPNLLWGRESDCSDFDSGDSDSDLPASDSDDSLASASALLDPPPCPKDIDYAVPWRICECCLRLGRPNTRVMHALFHCLSCKLHWCGYVRCRDDHTSKNCDTPKLIHEHIWPESDSDS